MSKPRQDNNVQIPADVLTNLLTPSEWRMLKNRYQIMNFLEDGLSIRKIANKVKVGTDTVVRTSRLIEKVGLRNKLSSKKIKSSTPWIFGKSE